MSLDSYRQAQTQTTSAALADAAGVGGQAPSIHDTRPWRWLVDGDTLELYAEPTGQLPASDPGGRMMVLSCGAALHHARTSLAAQGWRVEVDRIPVDSRPRLLARLTLSGRLAVTREAMRLLNTIRIRHTDRRPVTHTPVASSDVDAIRMAVEVEHARLHLLGPDDVLDLAAVYDRSQSLEKFDPRWREEMAGPDDDAAYAILFGTEDSPGAWLHAGEALSAAWLTAVEHGLSVLPLSSVVKVEATRVILRRLLAPLGEPFLVLRIGHADPAQAGVPGAGSK